MGMMTIKGINMDEAIKDEEIQDVSAVMEDEATVEIEEPEQKLSAREQKMQDVINQRQAQFDNNDGEPAVERDFQQVGEHLNDDLKDDTKNSDDDSSEIEQENKPESPVYLNENGEYVMKLKVNGQEVERSIEQMAVREQKNEAADLRLQQANERQQQLEQYEQLLRNREASINAQTVSQPSQQDAGSNVSEEEMDSFFEQIYDGNTDQAKALFKQLLEGRQQPTLDTNELRQQLTESAVIELEQRIQKREYDSSLSNGVKWLETSHPEIVNDPLLYRTIDTQTSVIERENPTFTPEQVIKEATKQVLDRIGSSKTSSRSENKAQLKSQPTRQANSRYIPPEKQEVDNSPQAIIARQKAQRAGLARRSV